MDKYTKSFFTLIERHEESVFAKPAFEVFNHECKGKHKFTFEGQKQGVAFYRAKIKELNKPNSVDLLILNTKKKINNTVKQLKSKDKKRTENNEPPK